MKLRPALPHQDIAGLTDLAAENLYAEPLALAISSVTRTAACFFVCHGT
jgi:hypothetical protein